jgi:hypothetical protein
LLNAVIVGYKSLPRTKAKRMLTAIVTVSLTFLLTGLIGNSVLQRWTHRNWLRQQMLLDRERELSGLEKLFDEVSVLAGRRQYRSRRLLLNLPHLFSSNPELTISEYAESVVAWNEALTSLYAKLTMQLEWSYTRRLEDIQRRFASISSTIDRAVSLYRGGSTLHSSTLKTLSDELDSLQGALFVFQRDVLLSVSRRRKDIYSSHEITEANLDGIPTWELFKALFQRRIQGADIL